MTPEVIIYLDVVEKNIKKMVNTLKIYNIKHRPHVKAHKSVYLAKKQIELGACGITCAKVTEAQVFVENGFNDVLIAFPIVGEGKLKLLGQLMKKAKITTIVNEETHANDLVELASNIGKSIPVLIEIDGGINRGGLKPGKDTIDFYNRISNLKGINVVGFLYYGGAIYKEKTLESIKEKTMEETKILLDMKKLLNNKDVNVLSTGSSFSSRFPEQLKGVTESRAGNYIFNDVNVLSVGLCKESDCALRIVTTVISIPNKGNAIIDAGSKTLTSDLSLHRKGYGYVVGYPSIEIYNLNEEHGFLRFNTDINLKVGQKLSIIPNHACVIPNLCDEVIGLKDNGEKVKIKIDARGRNK